MALGQYFTHLLILHSSIPQTFADVCTGQLGCREEPGGQCVALLDRGGRAWKVARRECSEGTGAHSLRAHPGDACP